MKALFIITPILLVGGIIGAGFMGIVPIPGITPKKAETKANALYTEGDEQPATEQEPSVEEEKIEPPAGATKTGIDTPIQDPSMQPKTESPTVTVTTQHASEPARDPVKGAKALAKYWDEIEVPKLIAITETYSDAELAQVLYFMQKKKVAELMSRVDADRASKLSRELQRLASVVSTTE